MLCNKDCTEILKTLFLKPVPIFSAKNPVATICKNLQAKRNLKLKANIILPIEYK